MLELAEVVTASWRSASKEPSLAFSQDDDYKPASMSVTSSTDGALSDLGVRLMYRVLCIGLLVSSFASFACLCSCGSADLDQTSISP